MNEIVERQRYDFDAVWSQANLLYCRWAERLGFSYPVLMTLYALEVHGPMTQKCLADRYGFPKQTIHGVVHRLVKDGTVALLPGETDRREKLVTLTGPGRELVRTRLAPLFDAEREALSVIGQERIDRMLDTIGLFNLLMGRNLQEA